MNVEIIVKHYKNDQTFILWLVNAICFSGLIFIRHFVAIFGVHFPLLFATLAGGSRFTKLDLAQAYQQMILEDDSKPYLTINTHLGLSGIIK